MIFAGKKVKLLLVVIFHVRWSKKKKNVQTCSRQLMMSQLLSGVGNSPGKLVVALRRRNVSAGRVELNWCFGEKVERKKQFYYFAIYYNFCTLDKILEFFVIDAI